MRQATATEYQTATYKAYDKEYTHDPGGRGMQVTWKDRHIEVCTKYIRYTRKGSDKIAYVDYWVNPDYLVKP